jgi:hypothetical protein
MPPRNSGAPSRGKTPPAKTPPNQTAAPKQAPPVREGITMLGAPGTGKTTFLAALQIALLRQPELGWSINGETAASTQRLVKLMDQMTDQHLFPNPDTQIENYRWSLEAEIENAIREWHWWGFRRRNKYIKIPLNLKDAPGEAANGRRMFGQAISTSLVANLARSAGIVLFFDPVIEYERGDAFRYTHGILTQLRSQAAQNGKLPHHLAVCITKFDEVPVLSSAQTLRAVQYEPGSRLPRVPEEYAKELLERLIKMSRADNADLILPLIQQTFHEDRVRYFVTSAIGFYVDPKIGVFDPEDYQNNIPGKPDRIRGGIFPINVLEPVLWLGRNMPRTAP